MPVIRRHFMLVAGVTLLAGGAYAQPPPVASSKTAKAAGHSAVTEGVVSARAERLAVDRAALKLATTPEAKNLRLYDAAGKEVPVARRTDGEITAEIDPRRNYVLAPPAPERRELPRGGLQFPARYITLETTGAPDGAPRTSLGGLFLRPSVVPLTWDDESRAYATDLLVGYEFDDGRENSLAAPKTVNFFVEGARGRIQDDRVTIERSGGSGYKRVRLTTGQIEGETRFTARAGPRDELRSSVTVHREIGGIALSMPSPELAAFGVGSAALTVVVMARDGMPVEARRPLEVRLTSRRLDHPATARIETGASAVEVEVRSTGIGDSAIAAQAGPFRHELPVRLVFPLAAVVAALAGGALGGTARYIRNRQRRRTLLRRRAVEGMLVGLIVVAAAWAGLVGIRMSTGVLGTPFGAFVLAALSGYLGSVVLDAVAGRTLGVARS